MIGGVDDDIRTNLRDHLRYLKSWKVHDAVEPPTTRTRLTLKHTSIKVAYGKWVSFDYGDAEVAFASLRVNNGQNELCFATDDSSDFSTLSRQDWLSTLDNMQHNYWDLGRRESTQR